MTKRGHIKLFRSIEEWEWIDDPMMFYFWVRLLLMANWEDKCWHGEVIKRGSFVTTIAGLSKQMHVSVQQVRTFLSRLKDNKQIVTTSTNKATYVTICKYEDYQGDVTNEKQTNNTLFNKRTTQTKEEYNTSDTNVSSYSIQEEKKIKKEGDTVVSPKKESTDLSFVLDLWNSYARRNVPKVRSLTQARKEKVRLRIKEMGGIERAKETLDTCFKKISESDFCTGASGDWAANFDWFFRSEEIWVKVLEGNYDNRKPKSQLEQLAELYQKGHEYYGQQYGYGGASAYGNPPGGGQDGPDEQ